MAKFTFANLPPTMDFDQAVVLLPYAIIALSQIVFLCFNQLILRTSRITMIAFLCLLWGICFHDRHQSPHGIANSVSKRISHDRLQRVYTHYTINATILMLELLHHAIALAACAPAGASMMILDDVLIEKPFARLIQGVYWDHDHTFNRKAKGIRLVVLLWTDGFLSIPVAFLVWHKRQEKMPSYAPRRYRTKNELARILVYCVLRKGLHFDVLVFDTWYASEENLRFFCRLGIVFVTAVQCNRRIRLPLKKPINHRHGKPTTHEKLTCKELALRYPKREHYSNYPALDLRARGFEIDISTKLKSIFLVIIKDYVTSRSFQLEVELVPKRARSKDKNKYLVTNFSDATVAWIISCYQRRWLIECLFREAKQHFAIGACQARNFEAVTSHIAISLFGYVVLQYLRHQFLSQSEDKDVLTLGEVRRKLNGLYQLKQGSKTWLISLQDNCENLDDALTKVLYEGINNTNTDRVFRYFDPLEHRYCLHSCYNA